MIAISIVFAVTPHYFFFPLSTPLSASFAPFSISSHCHIRHAGSLRNVSWHSCHIFLSINSFAAAHAAVNKLATHANCQQQRQLQPTAAAATAAAVKRKQLAAVETIHKANKRAANNEVCVQGGATTAICHNEIHYTLYTL